MVLISKNLFNDITRDLWTRKTRSFIILISLSMVIAFPVAFLNSGPTLTTSLDVQAEKSHLSQLEIFFLATPDLMIKHIDDLVNPTVIEGRIRAIGTLERDQGSNDQLNIISLPDTGLPTVNIPHVVAGTLSSSSGTTAILSSYASAKNIKIGDIINVKGYKANLSLIVTGLVDSIEFMSYDVSGNGVIFVNYDTAAKLNGYDLGLPFKIINDIILYFGPNSKIAIDFLKEKAKIITNDLENDDDTWNDPQFIWFTQKTSVRSALAQGAQLTAEYLGVAASFTILITGFIIFVIMNRYVTEQRKLIGIYHSFGFTPGEIISIYLGRSLLLALGAIFIGSISSIILLFIITKLIADLWGIDVLILYVSLPIFILFWIITLLCALVFALIPALQAARLTPYEALRHSRKIGTPGRGLINKLAEKLAAIPKMGVRTLTRYKLRTIMMIVAIIGSMSFSIALLSAFSSVESTKDNYFANNLKFDARVSYYDPQNRSELEHIQNLPEVLNAEPSFTQLTNPIRDMTEIVSIRGIEANTEHINLDILQRSPAFHGLQNNNHSNDAVVSSRVLSTLNLSLGDELVVKWKPGGKMYQNLTLKVMAEVRDFEYTIGVYVSLPFLINHLENKTLFINTITVQLVQGTSQDFIKTQLQRHEVNYVLSINDLIDETNRIINTQIVIVSLTIILGFIIAFISVFNTQYISIVERDRDMSIMQAFGYTRRWFFGEFLFEISLIVPASIFVSFYVSYPITQLFLGLIKNAVFQMDYYIGEREIIFSIIFLLFTATFAAILPAYLFISNKRLATILRSEE